MLATAGPTVAAVGSANNELGHPYTVLRADESTRFLVLELGARGIGHIRHLTEIAPPRIGAVLNVGTAHLGEFGSREAIAQAKGELVEAPAAGRAWRCSTPTTRWCRRWPPAPAARVVTFGTAARADVRAADVVLDDLGRPGFTLHAAGGHASGAAAAGRRPPRRRTRSPRPRSRSRPAWTLPAIAAALGAARPASRWRMEVTERADGVVVINDAYNANPESMRAALDALVAIAGRRGSPGGRRARPDGRARRRRARPSTRHSAGVAARAPA